MTEKKNQHFVPKLYLRFFSINKNNNQVGLFYLTRELYRQNIPLKSQAKEDYFYGEDGELEENLSKLENLAAPCLQEVILSNFFPKKLTDDYYKILAFSIIMANRTKDAAEEINEITDKMAKLMMMDHPEFKNDLDKYVIKQKNPAAMAVALTAKALPITFDLKIKLLINKTSARFITSDNPVVKYNQFLEQRKHFGGHVGLATKGLQIFFPISPLHMICFYDEWVYKIGDKVKSVIELTNSDDIDKLNELQILNCLDHLYFNEEISERYVTGLYAKVKNKRLSEYSALNKIGSRITPEGNRGELYHSAGKNLQTNLQLSFIVQTKRAKQHVLSNYTSQLRNEELRKNQ